MNPTQTCRDISELKAVAQAACILFMVECKKAGLDIFITETFRSQQRQNYLYEQGRTRPGDKVTWTRNSRHTSRLAWDIAVNRPRALYDTATLDKAGQIAKRLGITWGGEWEDIDRPHFEVSAIWKAPISAAATKTEKEGVRMFNPSTNTLKNEYVKMLQEAKKKGIISSNEWEVKTKDRRLSLDDAVALLASIQNRS